MRAVIQRVKQATVTVEGNQIASINKGFLVLLGIEEADNLDDIEWLTGKIIKLRVFGDENDAMNNSITDVDGSILVVSQFTLHASTKKGNRPSFIKAARPEQAIPLYESFVKNLETKLGKDVPTGEFGAMMDVAMVNDGPVTLIIDTKIKE